jgi:hypothetical protein
MGALTIHLPSRPPETPEKMSEGETEGKKSLVLTFEDKCSVSPPDMVKNPHFMSEVRYGEHITESALT